MELKKNLIKVIRSLDKKKYRDEYGLFVAEGEKSVGELLASALEIECILAKPEWIHKQSAGLPAASKEIIEISDRELTQISFQKTPNQVLALVKIPSYNLDMEALTGGLSLYLDQVQDPGNLGTILRVADWFGIRHVLCGPGCADPYHPKTVQSTMGAIIRVKTYQMDTEFFRHLHRYDPGFPVYGTFLDGENLYREHLSQKAVIVLGNESKGIGEEVARYVNRRLLIPSYPPGKPTSESLNVAIAGAVVCAEFRRRTP